MEMYSACARKPMSLNLAMYQARGRKAASIQGLQACGAVTRPARQRALFPRVTFAKDQE